MKCQLSWRIRRVYFVLRFLQAQVPLDFLEDIIIIVVNSWSSVFCQFGQILYTTTWGYADSYNESTREIVRLYNRFHGSFTRIKREHRIQEGDWRSVMTHRDHMYTNTNWRRYLISTQMMQMRGSRGQITPRGGTRKPVKAARSGTLASPRVSL